MREIKFRQAIYIKERFDHWHYWGFIDNAFIGIDTGTCSPKTAIENSQQFTGLKDKNGKEIYEGDILDACPSPNHNAYRKYLRTVEWNDELAQYQAPFSDRSGLMLFTKQQCKQYEVIGNIHENCKLLKEN